MRTTEDASDGAWMAGAAGKAVSKRNERGHLGHRTRGRPCPKKGAVGGDDRALGTQRGQHGGGPIDAVNFIY